MTTDQDSHRQESPNQGQARNDGAAGRSPNRSVRKVLKWILVIAALFFFFSVLREAVDPYGDQPYVEITHGDHVHYLPRDRDPNVPVSQFPTREPGPNERITPEGRIVPKESP